MLFFFKGRVKSLVAAVTGAAGTIKAVPNVRIGAAGAVRVVVVTAKAVIAIKGRFKIGARETVFSRTRLLRFA